MAARFINSHKKAVVVGICYAFALSLLPDDDGEVSGRFSGFMPEHEVTDKEALAARILMQRMGANVRQSGSEPQLN